MTMLSEMGMRIGSMLFERVLKVGNAASWERGLLEQPQLMRHNIKGAIVGQTFALLSGDPAHRTVADAYHGTMISVCFHRLRLNS